MNMLVSFFPLVIIAVAIFVLLRVVVFRNRRFGARGWRACHQCGRTCEPHAGFCPRCGMRL